MKTKKIYIIGQRPVDIPNNWIIFNAPRAIVWAQDMMTVKQIVIY